MDTTLLLEKWWIDVKHNRQISFGNGKGHVDPSGYSDFLLGVNNKKTVFSFSWKIIPSDLVR